MDEQEVTGVSPDDPKKPKPARMRKKPRGGDFFAQKLLSALGLVTGRYTKHTIWPFSRRKKPELKKKETHVETSEVTLTRTSTENPSIGFNTLTGITGHGGQPYSEPKGAPRIMRTNELGAFIEPPSITAPKGGKLIASDGTSTITGVLRFSVGEALDTPEAGGKGRIQITGRMPDGEIFNVYDSSWISTLGREQLINLSNLRSNATYTITIWAETWWAGSTEYMYDLQLTLTATVTNTYEVSKEVTTESKTSD